MVLEVRFLPLPMTDMRLRFLFSVKGPQAELALTEGMITAVMFEEYRSIEDSMRAVAVEAYQIATGQIVPLRDVKIIEMELKEKT